MPTALLSVEGIGKKKLELIRAQLQEQRESRDAIVVLRGYGLGASHARKVYRKCGKDTVALVRANPYRLACDVSGIGFITADRIARELGIPADSPDRLEAGVAYLMQTLQEQGHVFCPEAKLIKDTAKILGVDTGAVEKTIRRAAGKGLIVVERLFGQQEEESEGRAVFLPCSYTAEVSVAKGLITLLNHPHPLTLPNPDGEITTLEGELQIRFTRQQREAIKAALTCKVLVITGGPGTGKSTICSAIIRLCEKSFRKIAVRAPTGRASKRLSQVAGREAMTIHRLLQYNPSKGEFGRNGANPLKVQGAVVDEASMCDVWLMSRFLEALPRQAARRNVETTQSYSTPTPLDKTRIFHYHVARK